MGVGSASDRRRYNVGPSPIGRAHAQNDPKYYASRNERLRLHTAEIILQWHMTRPQTRISKHNTSRRISSYIATLICLESPWEYCCVSVRIDVQHGYSFWRKNK